MKQQSIAAGTPFRDQNYSAITLNWLQIRPQPEVWLGTIGAYIPEAHNRLVSEFLQTGCDRLLMVEDDLALEPNIIARCRGHQAEVVTGLYVQRRPPYSPVLYEKVQSNGVATDIQPDTLSRLIVQGHQGMGREVPIAGCGTGILSVHRKVFERLDFPWFEASPYAKDMGTPSGHDLYFCEKAREAGFRVTWDTSEMMRGIHVGWDRFDIDRWLDHVYAERAKATVAVS